MKEKFYPNCRMDQESGMLVCQPFVEKDGEIIDQASKPLTFKIQENGSIIPVSIEGASTDLIRRLKEAINNGDI